MKNENYWIKRQEEKLSSILDDSQVTSEYISKIYSKACSYTQEKIKGIFQKYKKDSGLTAVEARQLLSSMIDEHDYSELKRLLENNPSSEERKELLKQLNAPAYQKRIKRLENMQNQLDQLMNEVYKIERDKSTDSYITSAFNAYYKDIYNLQKGIGVAYQFDQLDPDLVNNMLHSKWSGKNYSDRIWNNTNALADSLKDEMMLGVLTNKTEKEMSDTIMNKFAVGAFQARRLIQTETAAMVSFVDQLAYQDAGIEKEMFIAVHDGRTSKVCQQHDRTIVEVSKAVVGKNVPPLHPNCRSHMIAYVESITDSMKKRQRNPITGRDEVVDVKENYDQWLKRQQKEHGIGSIEDFRKNVKKANDKFSSDDLSQKLKNNIKSKLLNDKVTSFDDLPESLKENFLVGLEKSDILTKKILNSVYKDVSYSYNPNHSSSSAMPLLNVVFLKNEDPSTIAHELYHIIDYKYNVTSGNLLKLKLDNDYLRLLELSNNDLKKYIKNSFLNAFTFEKNSFKMKEEYRGISDILNGLSQGQLYFGYGHSKKYWKSKPNLYVIEAWAQFGRIGYDGNENVIEMFVELFPEFSNEVVRISKRLGEK